MTDADPTIAIAPIVLRQPASLAFGAGCAARVADELSRLRCRRAMIVTGARSSAHAAPLGEAAANLGIAVHLHAGVPAEPTTAYLDVALAAARVFEPDVVIGVGGGSPLDVAKLIAALWDAGQSINDAIGVDRLRGRRTRLICVPTTAGTGSEVSPNAVLLDGAARLKKGVVSPYLVPDAAFVDPLLTLSVPGDVTGATGIDALTHCIEAYANRFAHPIVDTYAIAGIRLIAANLPTAVADGENVAARSAVALGSLYGGLCLGPVNTAAVHALAYPLGGEFGVGHGVANAVLLPHVLSFNLPAAPARYAAIARALGAAEGSDDTETARHGIARLVGLCAACQVPRGLAALNVPRDAVPRMAAAAMGVTRLMERNPRTLSEADVVAIYGNAF